ncbi:fibronectin type III domain-containing protein [Candidatus Gottesmanbacteria bacterium]|nr:fibronectin type III domain-containing protein [Candidatus Gottesmanbacteria bacterium]
MKVSKLLTSLGTPVTGVFFLSLLASPIQAAMPFNFVGGPGSTPGTINLSWQDTTNKASSYSLSYGYTSNAGRFGVLNIPEGPNGNSTFTVGALTPGVTYYFILNAFQGNSFVSTTGPIAVTATSGTVATAPVAVSAPAPVAAAPVTTPSTNPWVTNPTFGVQAVTGTKSGTVTLSWFDSFSKANSYALMYGFAPGQNTWGALNIPEGPGGATTFTVGALTPGQRYYFTLVSWQGGTFVKLSNPVSAVAR